MIDNMKLLVNINIKSISNAITNSSSEVFVMCKTDAEYYDRLKGTNGCVNIHEITWDWLKEEGSDEWKMVCTTCNIDDGIFKDYVVDTDYGCWYNSVQQDEWEAFLELYKDAIQKYLIGFYWVDIEDHFEDAIEVSDEARGDSIWSDYRH